MREAYGENEVSKDEQANKIKDNIGWAYEENGY